jgi:hypothetical protein
MPLSLGAHWWVSVSVLCGCALCLGGFLGLGWPARVARATALARQLSGQPSLQSCMQQPPPQLAPAMRVVLVCAGLAAQVPMVLHKILILHDQLHEALCGPCRDGKGVVSEGFVCTDGADGSLMVACLAAVLHTALQLASATTANVFLLRCSTSQFIAVTRLCWAGGLARLPAGLLSAEKHVGGGGGSM